MRLNKIDILSLGGLSTMVFCLALFFIIPLQYCEGNFFSSKGLLCKSDMVLLVILPLVGILLGGIISALGVIIEPKSNNNKQQVQE